MKSWIMFLSLIIFANYVFATDTIHPVTITRHFGAEDGLGTKTIYSVVQDANGFIWFATDAGAFRYDGNEFRRYTVEDGLSDNEILSMHIDSTGRLWFLTYNGYLSFYHNGKIYNAKNSGFLSSIYLGGSFTQAYDDAGRILFASFKRGYVSLKDTVVKKILLNIKDREMSFPYLTKGVDGTIWYFRGTSIVNSVTDDSIPINEPPFAYCTIDGIGEALFMNKNGVFKISNLKITPYIIDNSLPDYTKVVSLFYEKESDNLWICTLGRGCTLFHDGKFVKNYLPNSSVTGILRDSEGNLWITTMNESVYVYYKNSNYVTNYDKNSGLTDNKIFSVATDAKNNLWVGFFNGEVDKISGTEKTAYKLKTWNNADYLRTMCIISHNDTTWCANDGGIYFIAGDAVHKVMYPDPTAILNNYSVKHLIIDEHSNVYGSFAFNLLKVNKAPPVYYCSTIFDSLMRVFAAVKTKDGRFYVSTIMGLVEYLPGQYLKHINHDYDFSQLRILDLKITDDGDLILSTNANGVFIIRNERIVQHITTNDYLTNNSCRKLFLDHNDLYICTQNGLNIFTKQNGKWIFKNEINKRDGLLDNSINDMTANDSLLFIATDGGLSIVNKKVFTATHFTRKVYISDIILDKPELIRNNEISFYSTINRIIIKYSYPVFNPANRRKFLYRLSHENENSEWINTSGNQIQFSSLDPGTYLFEVKPYSERKSLPVSTLKIQVLPMWWQTIMAKIIFIFLFVLAISFVIKQWTKMQFENKLRALKQTQMIEAERNRIASDMHDDIGADLTQISMLSNVLKGSNGNTRVLVDKISLLSNEVLSKMDQIIWALNSIHDNSTDLVGYLHSYAEEYLENNNIELQFDIPSNIPDLRLTVFQRRNIFLVLKELLHNTVKHSNASKVSISVYFDDSYFGIDYCDNGKGFSNIVNTNRHGLITMTRRLEEINSTIKFDTEAEIGMKAIIRIDTKTKNFSS